MADLQLYDGYKRLLAKFYEKAIKKHANRSQHAKKFNNWIAKAGLPEDDSNKMCLKTVEPRRNQNLDVEPSMKSLRITTSSSKNALDVSRSKNSRRSDSSREKSEGESRFFGVDWVYSSPNESRVYVFAALAAFIVNDNSVGFFMLQDRINQHLTENTQSIPPILMISINKYWQRIVEIVTKKKSYLWEKHLKQPIDRMPLEFNKLISRIIAGKEFRDDGFSKEEIGKLSKEGRINLTNFQINCREIEKIEREGTFNNQIIIGYLKHSKNYVIANKMPEYSQNELKHRKTKNFIQRNVEQLLREYKADEQELNFTEESNLPNEKQRIVKQFFSKKLEILKSS